MILVKNIFVINLLKLCAIKSRERQREREREKERQRQTETERQRNVAVHSMIIARRPRLAEKLPELTLKKNVSVW